MKRTNVVLDPQIVAQAQEITGMSTIREVIDFALRELVRRKQIQDLIELKGAIEWDGDLDEMRQSRSL